MEEQFRMDSTSGSIKMDVWKFPKNVLDSMLSISGSFPVLSIDIPQAYLQGGAVLETGLNLPATIEFDFVAADITVEPAETRRKEVLGINDDLAKAIELIHAGLLLRMHGDIAHQPMTQADWDSKAEAFLRAMNDED